MNRRSLNAVAELLQELSGMSGRTHREVREPWMGTVATDRARCEGLMETVRTLWDGPEEELRALDGLVKKMLDAYTEGNIDAGDFALRDVDEFIFELRHRDKPKPTAH